MDKKQFYDKVVEMRRLQKEYFRTRDKNILKRSKAAEKEIDDEIKRVNAILERQINQVYLTNDGH